MENVVVTNRNEFEFVGKFDGKEYRFPTDEPVTISVLVAGFLFGFGKSDADRQRAIIRQGWQKNNVPGADNGPEHGVMILNKFMFTMPEDELPVVKMGGKPEAEKEVPPAPGGERSILTLRKKAPLAHPAKAA